MAGVADLNFLSQRYGIPIMKTNFRLKKFSLN